MSAGNTRKRVVEDARARALLLQELGARAQQIESEALAMLAQGTPRSGIDHWVARELFCAVRSLGLLPSEEAAR